MYGDYYGIGKYTGSTPQLLKLPTILTNFGVYVYNDDATCEKNGTETAVCVTCGETYTREVPSTALGHDYIEKEQPKPPVEPDEPTPDVTPTPTPSPEPAKSAAAIADADNGGGENEFPR